MAVTISLLLTVQRCSKFEFVSYCPAAAYDNYNESEREGTISTSIFEFRKNPWVHNNICISQPEAHIVEIYIKEGGTTCLTT